MKKISLGGWLIFALGIVMLSACGGGGGGTSVTAVPSEPTTAVLTLSTTTTSPIPAGATINSYIVAITLPDSVTLKSTVTPSETDAGVVTAAGVASNSWVKGVYTAATNSAPGMVKVYVVSGPGFGPGVFCTVTGKLAAGSRPTAADFKPLTIEDATGLVTSPSVSTVILTGQLHLTGTVALY